MHPRPVGRRSTRLPAATDENLDAAHLRAIDQLVRESALAEELPQFSLAPHEDGAATVALIHLPKSEIESRILRQDCSLELAQRRARVDPELLDENAPALLKGLERLRLPSGTVEGEHQLPAKALAERMLSDEPLQLADDVGMQAERELRLDSFLERGHAQLFQPRNLGLDEALVTEVRQRAVPPERERLA